MKPFPALLPILLLAMTALAGCNDDGGGGDGGDGDKPLPADKGAISGLLINDVYRPVPDGLVLLQPVGLTATSDASGQFSFTDLEPGAYILRIQAEGHEAAPVDVEVVAGEYTESEVVARRVLNEGSRIITTEYSVFIPCSVDYVANGNVIDCTFDQSGDSFRANFVSDYSGHANVTYLVTEMKANKVGRYEVQLRCESVEREGEETSEYYSVSQFEGDYTKMVMPLHGVSEQAAPLSYGDNQPWQNDCELNTILFSDSQFREEVQQNWPDNPVVGPPCCGVGAHFGIKAKFVQSLFLGEPEVDVASYSVLG